MSLPLAAIAVAFVHKPRLLTPVTPGRGVVAPGNRPPIARSPPIRAVVNDTLTVGDALLGALNRQMDQLPDSEHLRRAERTLDALVDSGSAELEALKQAEKKAKVQKLSHGDLRRTPRKAVVLEKWG